MKTVIVINGAGGVGKDTLCNIVAKYNRVLNVSSIDPIKDVARDLGWNGDKDLKSRKLLSDLKQLSVKYNNLPTSYLIDKYHDFLSSEYEIMFVHIREPEEIKHFVEAVGNHVITLLIRRRYNEKMYYGNTSDDDVEDYNYDYIYNNDCLLEEIEDYFIPFLKWIIDKNEDKYGTN